MNLKITDPEYIERFNHFAFDEVVNADESLDTKTRYMAILATLIGCQGTDAYREMLGKALDDKVSPIVIKEVVYQATDYLGYGRTLNFLNITNEVFAEREMITFCFLSAQGGCEPQLIAHSKGNMNMGNDKEFLTKVVLQCVPYIGYPRSLNAINCINKACE